MTCIQDTYRLFQIFSPLFHLDFCNLQLVTDGLISVHYETVYCMFSDYLGFTIEYIYSFLLLLSIDQFIQYHINSKVFFKAFKLPNYFIQCFLHQLKIIWIKMHCLAFGVCLNILKVKTTKNSCSITLSSNLTSPNYFESFIQNLQKLQLA